MHKAKIGPDMAHVGASIRLSQLLCQNYLETLQKDLLRGSFAVGAF